MVYAISKRAPRQLFVFDVLRKICVTYGAGINEREGGEVAEREREREREKEREREREREREKEI